LRLQRLLRLRRGCEAIIVAFGFAAGLFTATGRPARCLALAMESWPG
jgi:hypothetical protein